MLSCDKKDRGNANMYMSNADAYPNKNWLNPKKNRRTQDSSVITTHKDSLLKDESSEKENDTAKSDRMVMKYKIKAVEKFLLHFSTPSEVSACLKNKNFLLSEIKESENIDNSIFVTLVKKHIKYKDIEQIKDMIKYFLDRGASVVKPDSEGVCVIDLLLENNALLSFLLNTYDYQQNHELSDDIFNDILKYCLEKSLRVDLILKTLKKSKKVHYDTLECMLDSCDFEKLDKSLQHNKLIIHEKLDEKIASHIENLIHRDLKRASLVSDFFYGSEKITEKISQTPTQHREKVIIRYHGLKK